jgi:hypothetical protein
MVRSSNRIGPVAQPHLTQIRAEARPPPPRTRSAPAGASWRAPSPRRPPSAPGGNGAGRSRSSPGRRPRSTDRARARCGVHRFMGPRPVCAECRAGATSPRPFPPANRQGRPLPADAESAVGDETSGPPSRLVESRRARWVSVAARPPRRPDDTPTPIAPTSSGHRCGGDDPLADNHRRQPGVNRSPRPRSSARADGRSSGDRNDARAEAARSQPRSPPRERGSSQPPARRVAVEGRVRLGLQLGAVVGAAAARGGVIRAARHAHRVLRHPGAWAVAGDD